MTVTDDFAKQFDDLKREFYECRDNVGSRMVRLEVENAQKLTRLETQMITVVATMSSFVTSSRFRPVELIAFGLAGGVMTTALGMVLARAFGVIG